MARRTRKGRHEGNVTRARPVGHCDLIENFDSRLELDYNPIMNNSAEIERLLALRPFDKKGFEDVHERIRTQMNTLKSAQRGFNNQDAIDPLLIIAHTAMESAEKLLDEDAESFDRATRTAAKQALFALSEAIASNRIRMAAVASGNLAKVDTQPAEQDAFVLTPA